MSEQRSVRRTAFRRFTLGKAEMSTRLAPWVVMGALAIICSGCAGQQPGTLTTIGNEDGAVGTLFPYKPPYYYQTSQGLMYFCPNGSAAGGVCHPVSNGLYNYYRPNDYSYQPAPPPPPYQPAPYQPAPAPTPAPQPNCPSGNWLVSGACAAETRPQPQPVPQPRADPQPGGSVPADIDTCGWWRLNNLWDCNHP